MCWCPEHWRSNLRLTENLAARATVQSPGTFYCAPQVKRAIRGSAGGWSVRLLTALERLLSAHCPHLHLSAGVPHMSLTLQRGCSTKEEEGEKQRRGWGRGCGGGEGEGGRAVEAGRPRRSFLGVVVTNLGGLLAALRFCRTSPGVSSGLAPCLGFHLRPFDGKGHPGPGGAPLGVLEAVGCWRCWALWS